MSDWNNMDQWYAVLPPSRPTYNELLRIESFLESIDRNEPVAILGSTPEFRELLYRMGFHYRFIFDKSISFYERMGRLIPQSTTVGELLVVGDWLNSLSKWENTFKVILSDLTMGNISYDQRGQFYSGIANALKVGGAFIDKILAFDFEVPTLDSLFRKYELLPINLRTINDFSSEVLFCSDLVMRNCIVDSTEFYSIIRNGDFSEKIKFFAEAAKIVTPEGFLWYYGVRWDELEKDYSKFYSSQTKFIEEEVASPYYHRTKQYFNIK